MRVCMSALLLTLAVSLVSAQEAPAPLPSSADELLDQALALAKSVPDRAQRADAVGRVAAEIAKTDPKRALEALRDELGTHEASLAMAASAQSLARDNRLLGLATLLRIHEISTLMVALARIVAMETLTHFDDAVDIVANVEPLTVRRMVEREVTRAIWAETSGDRATAVDTAIRWAQSISDPVTRDEALAYAAEGAATVDLARAQKVALSIKDTEAQDLALRLVLQRLASADVDAAQALLGKIQSPLQHDLAAASVVEGLMGAGRSDEALALTSAVRTSVAEKLENPLDQSVVRERLALAMAEADPAGALSVASEVWPPAQRYALQGRLARTVGRTDAQRAQEILRDAWIEVGRLDVPMSQQRVTASVLASAAVVAPEFIDTMAESRPALVQEALPGAVDELVAEDPKAALRLADRITDAPTAQQTRADIVSRICATQPELARSIAQGLAMPGPKSAALVALAAAVRAG